MHRWFELSPRLESLANMSLSSVDALGHEVLPPQDLIFRAFEAIPPEAVTAVILGLDPYPTPGDAMGLAFSVRDGCGITKSMRNIAKEYRDDLGVPMSSYDLSPWTRQGVLLANTALTVKAHAAKSHLKEWAAFTQEWIDCLSRLDTPRVWLLWGNDAQKYEELINKNGGPGVGHQRTHTSPHPSPLSVYRGFAGSRPFSKTNALLCDMGGRPVDWRLCSDFSLIG